MSNYVCIVNKANLNKLEIWKHIKTHSKSKTVNPTNVSLDEMFTHFSNLYGEQTSKEQTLPQNDNDIYIHDIDLDQEFTEMEVKSAIMSHINSKSPGTDLLIPEALKGLCDILLPFLTNLYTNIFNTGIYPESWTEGIIVPIFNGGKHEANNFRRITLNNIISKIYSKLLVTRLVKWSEKSNTIIDNQIGVQKNNYRLLVHTSRFNNQNSLDKENSECSIP